MFLNIIAIFLGGGIGALLRYFISIGAKHFFALSILGTFTSNIIGCFIIGLLFGLAINKTDALPQILRLFIIVGILGSLTTFSTLNLEVFDFIRNGKLGFGILYMALSCVVGLFFTYLGYQSLSFYIKFFK